MPSRNQTPSPPQRSQSLPDMNSRNRPSSRALIRPSIPSQSGLRSLPGMNSNHTGITPRNPIINNDLFDLRTSSGKPVNLSPPRTSSSVMPENWRFNVIPSPRNDFRTFSTPQVPSRPAPPVSSPRTPSLSAPRDGAIERSGIRNSSPTLQTPSSRGGAGVRR